MQYYSIGATKLTLLEQGFTFTIWKAHTERF
jgi:hypothetical protein